MRVGIETVQIFYADDGKKFLNEEECRLYESNAVSKEVIREKVKQLLSGILYMESGHDINSSTDLELDEIDAITLELEIADELKLNVPDHLISTSDNLDVIVDKVYNLQFN